MIYAEGVTKRYGNTMALDGLSLAVPDGSIFGLLGPNGSGKSTFIKLLMQFIFPDAGRIEAPDLPVQRIGYVPERPAFPMRARLAEYLVLTCRLCGLAGNRCIQEAAWRLQQVGLAHAAQWHIATCSKGMLQRLALAAALVDEPRLLVLDEPMNGLDPAAQHDMRALIGTMHGQGKTVLLSTHQLADVAQLCTHVAILQRGKLVRAGSLVEVLPLRRQVTITVDRLSPAVAAGIQALHPAVAIQGNAIILADEAVCYKAAALHHLLDAGVDILGLDQQRATLEEIYLEAVSSRS